MKQIYKEQDNFLSTPVDSIIYDDTYIIPGSCGKTVDVDSSFVNMHKDNKYDIDKYVFTFIKPNISLENNKDKIIIRGNKNKKGISLIFESINDKTKYLKQNDYKINVLLSKEEYDLYYELINNSNNETIHNNIESFLNKHRLNSNICILKNDKMSSLCKDKYLVLPSLIVTHSNISSIKNKISSGEIILIKDSVTLEDLNIILKQIKSYELSIIPLSELIKE